MPLSTAYGIPGRTGSLPQAYVNPAIPIGLGIYLPEAYCGFTPEYLFAGGAFGFWHDYTDPSTWFQDTAGTTPAAALGDPVGRVNDKSGNGITGLQSTSAARPTRGRMPLGGVRNQLTYTEGLTNAAWSKNSVTAPDANTIVETTANAPHTLTQSTGVTSGNPYTQSLTLVKGIRATAPNVMQITFGASGFGAVQYANVNVLTGAVELTAGGATCVSSADPNIAGGWRFEYTATATATTTSEDVVVAFCNNNAAATRAPSYAGSTTADCKVYFAQSERGSTASNYQKVVQDYDVTESGVESVPCIWFDGVDDHLVLTATGSGIARNTGRFTVFASGLHTKALTSTQFQFAATMSASAATRASIGGAATNINTVQARRTAADSYSPSLESPANAFTPYIRTAVLSYATRLGELRVNGALADSDATFFTAGNTEDSDSQNVYVARTSTSYFGGFMTGIVAVKGVTLSGAQVLQTDQYLGNQIGVTI